MDHGYRMMACLITSAMTLRSSIGSGFGTQAAFGGASIRSIGFAWINLSRTNQRQNCLQVDMTRFVELAEWFA